MDNNRLLVVDDEPGLRNGTKRLLEGEGYSVTACENGFEALEAISETDFKVAIIDLKMPDMDGIEVLQKIKNIKPFTMCIVATAYASYDTAIEATRIGAFSYIPKPFTPDEILHQIRLAQKQRALILESVQLKKDREERLLELANEKSRLSTIIKSISDGVLVINKEGNVVYFNNSLIKNLNFTELNIGDKAYDLLPKEILKIVNSLLNSKISEWKSKSIQIEIIENSLFVEVAATPVFRDNDQVAGIVLVVRNISELKKIEMIKSQFVSMVAHELKTPVSAVMGFINLILDPNIETSPEKEEEYLSKSFVRLKGLLDLVGDLLDISRMEMKTKTRQLEMVDLQEIVNNTIKFLEFDIRKKSILLTTKFINDLPKIKGDYNELTRMFTNILSNAIKYNKNNGQIKVDTAVSSNYIIIQISDTGIGLRTEELSKLFQEFYRAKNEFTRGISGTGLGLTIVKRLIDLYHGKIKVDSEYRKGTTISIQLPLPIK